MSTGNPIPLFAAEAIAETLKEILAWQCERVEIAGSIRRKKELVRDIEIVCIPPVSNNLFGENFRSAARVEAQLRKCGFTCPKINGDHFKQFDAGGGLNCDLFLTTPECWGVIFTLRTGCADFSRRLVTSRQQGGLLPSNLKVRDGRIWNGDEALQTPEEKDVFKVLGLDWIPPEKRTH